MPRSARRSGCGAGRSAVAPSVLTPAKIPASIRFGRVIQRRPAARNRKFESTSLQRRVRRNPSPSVWRGRLGSAGGQDALDLLERDRQFDLLIVDLAMPNMNGDEFAARAPGLLPGVPTL